MNGNAGTEPLTETAPMLVETTALEVINRSEIDMQIATAHRFPRSIHEFQTLAEEMATLDQETAESCFYRLKRRGADGTVNIEGESVRFAEICASAFGNIRYGAYIVSIDERSVTAQGYAHDLEKNNHVQLQVRRTIVTKNGRRYSEDMINVTANAACAIAYRNCLMKVIPKSLTTPTFAAAKAAAVGDRKTLDERRRQALAHFEKLGVTQDRILLRLEKAGVEDIDLDDLELLTGLKTALKEQEISLAEAFPEEIQGEEEQGDRSSTIARRIRDRRGQATDESQESESQ